MNRHQAQHAAVRRQPTQQRARSFERRLRPKAVAPFPGSAGLAVSRQGERERVYGGWIDRSLPGGGNRVRRRTRQALVEMQRDLLVSACGEERLSEALTLGSLQQGRRQPD